MVLSVLLTAAVSARPVPSWPIHICHSVQFNKIKWRWRSMGNNINIKTAVIHLLLIFYQDKYFNINNGFQLHMYRECVWKK